MLNPRRSRDAIIAIIAAAAIMAHLLLRYFFRLGPVHLLPLYFALLAGGIPLLAGLLRQILKRQFGSDLLAGFSIVTGVLLHQYLVACIVVLMLSGGSALEQYATERASAALRALAKRIPLTAHLLAEGGFVEVNAQQIVPGQIIAIFPHEVSPVDGEVVQGYGEMDESYLTGEPFHIQKAPGAQVLSGAVNGNTALQVRATRLPVDSRYSRILKVVEEAEKNRPSMRRIADRLGAWYTPAALLIALLGWLVSGSPERFLAVVVIATPCPLLIAIPVAIIGGISLAARRGIVIKRPAILETIDTCRTFFFDKTGTLTYGRPVLSDILCAPGFNEAQVLFYAGGLEQYSRHPLAQAIIAAASARGIKTPVPATVTEKPGEGLSGSIDGHQVRITGRNSLAAGLCGSPGLYGRGGAADLCGSPGLSSTEAAAGLCGSPGLSSPEAGAGLCGSPGLSSPEGAADLCGSPGLYGRGGAFQRPEETREKSGASAPVLPPVDVGLECVVLVDGNFAALLRFHDEPRRDSHSFIRHLQPSHQAKEVVLLSGDRLLEVEHLARFVGIEQIHAGMTPEEKFQLVRQAAATERILFVGDGINDAPAMLAATASVALGGQNNDVASEAADAVVLDSSLRRVDELIHIARRTRSIALQSALGGMLLSVVGMGAAAAGYLPPLSGAICQEIIDLAAVLNALRITLPQASMSDF